MAVGKTHSELVLGAAAHLSVDEKSRNPLHDMQFVFQKLATLQ